LADKPFRFKIEFLEMLPEKTVQVGSSGITPFLVPHQENEVSFGFSIFIDGRKILYSGDTGWTEALTSHSQGADLFICECSFFETRFPYHLDYPQLAENRKRFGAKRIILTHLGREVLARRAEIDMEMATDGLIVDI
jgi:ribonuclease BN (tRNA processing enzyme)